MIAIAVAALLITYDNPCLRESNYYCIRVYQDEPASTSSSRSTRSIHGIVSVKDPTELVYPYERLYGQVMDAKYKATAASAHSRSGAGRTRSRAISGATTTGTRSSPRSIRR